MAVNLNKYTSTCKIKSAEELAKDMQEMQNELIDDFNNDACSVFDCEFVPHKTFFPTDIADKICDVEQIDEDNNTNFENELNDTSECSQEMLDEIKKYGEELQKKVDLLTDTINSISYLDEWLKNLEQVYYYHKTKISQQNKKYNVLDAEAGALKLVELETLGTVEIAAAITSWSKLLGVKVDIKTRGKVIFNFNFRYQYKEKLKKAITNIHEKYNDVGLSDFLEDSKSLTYYSYDESKADGFLYNRYYDLMKHPIDNFFTPAERGLVSSKKKAYTMDVPDTVNENSKEDEQVEYSKYIAVDVYDNSSDETKTYYVGNDETLVNGKTNYQRYQDFYNTLFKEEFDERCNKKYKQIQKAVGYKLIYNLLQDAAKDEVKLISKKSESYLVSCDFVNMYKTVQALQERLKQIKTEIQQSISVEKIKEDLKNVPCFKIEDFDEILSVEPDDSYGPNDPSLPNITKICYWAKFCECATLYNLTSPYPEMVDSEGTNLLGMPLYMKSMRYWPVGFICPSPAGLIKVPLPVIYAPLFCLSSPMGTIVLLIGLSGIFPTVYLMYFATDGSISFAATAGAQGVTEGNMSFNFTSESEDDLLYMIGIDKTFKVPLMTPQEMVEYELQRAELLKQMADQKVVGAINKIRSKMDEKQTELHNKYKMMKAAKDGSFDINDEINKIRNIFNDALDYINLDEYALDVVNDVEGFIEWCLSKLKLPVITFPDDLFDIMEQNPIDTLITTTQELLAMNIGLTGKTEDLRALVVDIIGDLMYSKKVNLLLQRLPETMFFINAPLEELQKLAEKGGEAGEKIKDVIENFDERLGDFPKFKAAVCDIIDLALESADPNIFANDQRFLDYFNMVKDAFNQYNCKTTCTVNDNDLSLSIAFLQVLGQGIRAAINTLELSDFMKLFSSLDINGLENGYLEMGRDMVLSIIEELIYKYVPEIPIVDVLSEFNVMKGNVVQAAAKMSKISAAFSAITADVVKDFFLRQLMQIPIDLNMFIDMLKEPIAALVSEELGKVKDVIASVTEIRELIREAIDNFFDVAQKELQPFIDAYNVAINTFKMLKKLKEKGVKFNMQDLILRTKECMAKLKDALTNLDRKEIIKKLLGLDGVVMCDVKLSQLAIMALKEFGVAFNNHFIIAAVCCLAGDSGKNVIRTLNPVSFSDDLPPYERLNLKNPLFCLFLDSFCAEARKYGGYDANFLPIGN